jgi:hypothetical protein
MGMKVCGGCKI